MKAHYSKVIVVILLLFAFNGFSQNAKKIYKEGKKELKEENFSNAISLFSQAIDFDNNFAEAYIDRATAYEKTDMKAEAAADFSKASTLIPKDFTNFFNAGRLYYDLKEYEKAVNFLNQSTNLEKKHLESFQLK